MEFSQRIWTLLFLSSFIVVISLSAQDPLRFKEQIKTFQQADQQYLVTNGIVFTGSSSIRMWKDVQERFPEYTILNRGFGGSHMSDLLYFVDELVIKYKPKKVFIYEGDNDTSAGKSVEEVLKDAQALVNKINSALTEVEILFISPKPSVARWHLKEKYERLNAALKEWSNAQDNIKFIDVWTPMLADDGQVRKDIFIKDNLHMNSLGYDIWEEVIKPFLK